MIDVLVLKNSLTEFVREYGRYPSKLECKNSSVLYGWNTYWRHLGSQEACGILEDVYSESPKQCPFCTKPIEFERRAATFCDQSCAAKYNNKVRARQAFCAFCQDPMPYRGGKTYCSPKCTYEHRTERQMKEWLITGQFYENRTILKFLIKLDGYQCKECGISEWNGKRITLEVEHIDGDSEDSSRQNVCLLCPNCHSQTPTYKAKNKGSGRASRRARYAAGKSY
jgi:hypothetical protein